MNSMKLNTLFESLPEELKDKYINNRSIVISLKSNFKLYFLNILQIFGKCLHWGQENVQLIRLFKRGETRIATELNMVNIINKLNNLDIWF